MLIGFEYFKLFFVILWFFIFIFSLILELQLKQLSLINFSLSALITAVCGVIFADVPQQLIIFMGLALIIKILLHPLYKKNKIRRIFNNQICAFIGREAKVTKKISPNEIGELQFCSINWEAIGAGDYTLEIGEVVLISGRSGINLVASKLKRNQNIPISNN